MKLQCFYSLLIFIPSIGKLRYGKIITWYLYSHLRKFFSISHYFKMKLLSVLCMIDGTINSSVQNLFLFNSDASFQIALFFNLWMASRWCLLVLNILSKKFQSNKKHSKVLPYSNVCCCRAPRWEEDGKFWRWKYECALFFFCFLLSFASVNGLRLFGTKILFIWFTLWWIF